MLSANINLPERPPELKLVALMACGAAVIGLLLEGIGKDTPSAHVAARASIVGLALVLWRLFRLEGR